MNMEGQIFQSQREVICTAIDDLGFCSAEAKEQLEWRI